MATPDYIDALDLHIEDALFWVEDTLAGTFDIARLAFTSFYDGLYWLFTLPPYYVTCVIFAILGWRIIGLFTGIVLGVLLLLCELMQLWDDTMSTLALVLAATVIALLVAVPGGLVAGYIDRFSRIMKPILDGIQTFPPYIYLLPGIALLGYGPATALVATVVFAIPPAFRLTALGIRQTPTELLELGQVAGATRLQQFFKIRLPMALPSIMAGVNQTLMLAFGMVVIAGIVGSGGLGQTIYVAIVNLDVAKSIDATVAIVVLTVLLDRLSQGLVPRAEEVHS